MAGEAMVVERDTSQPELEPDRVKPTHIYAKGKGEVAQDLDNLLEETAEELDERVLITGVSDNNIFLLEDTQGSQEMLKIVYKVWGVPGKE